jgi:hypothetical protein
MDASHELGKTAFVLGPEDPFVPAKINAGKERCRSAVHSSTVLSGCPAVC